MTIMLPLYKCVDVAGIALALGVFLGTLPDFRAAVSRAAAVATLTIPAVAVLFALSPHPHIIENWLVTVVNKVLGGP
jgi:hypothetical protein